MVQEGHLLAVFNSGHRIMKAESILKAQEQHILLMPAPRQLQTDCGLALRFEQQHREQIMALLEQADLLPEFIARYENALFTIIWKRDTP